MKTVKTEVASSGSSPLRVSVEKFNGYTYSSNSKPTRVTLHELSHEYVSKVFLKRVHLRCKL